MIAWVMAGICVVSGLLAAAAAFRLASVRAGGLHATSWVALLVFDVVVATCLAGLIGADALGAGRLAVATGTSVAFVVTVAPIVVVWLAPMLLPILRRRARLLRCIAAGWALVVGAVVAVKSMTDLLGSPSWSAYLTIAGPGAYAVVSAFLLAAHVAFRGQSDDPRPSLQASMLFAFAWRNGLLAVAFGSLVINFVTSLPFQASDAWLPSLLAAPAVAVGAFGILMGRAVGGTADAGRGATED